MLPSIYPMTVFWLGVLTYVIISDNIDIIAMVDHNDPFDPYNRGQGGLSGQFPLSCLPPLPNSRASGKCWALPLWVFWVG